MNQLIYWDTEKQQSRSKRVCIAKLDESGNLIPSKRFSEPQPVLPLKRGPVPMTQAKQSFHGTAYLFDT